MQPAKQAGIWEAIGPGLVFAATAVGVSHLVQSTRAGANYGLALLLVVVLANLFKYPAFRFGPQYAVATGTSLLEGYRRQGKGVLVLYLLLTLGTMLTVQAAVTIVTAGLLMAVFGLHWPIVLVCGILMAICAVILVFGRYRLLDRITKTLIALLTFSTVIATAMVFSKIPWTSSSWLPNSTMLGQRKTILFVAALVGWMPSAIDVAVWQSLWTLARRRDTKHTPTLQQSMLDFHIGYIGTSLLAVCFVLLGAGVMFPTGKHFGGSAGQFANQVINLYVETLGGWSRPIIGIAALAVMFSTTLTVIDGFPRALSVLVARFRGPEPEGGDDPTSPEQRKMYWLAIAALGLGSLLVLTFALRSLKTLVDVATTLSFLTAPALAIFNHRAVCSADVPKEMQPKPWLVGFSHMCNIFLTLFALYYLYIQYVAKLSRQAKVGNHWRLWEIEERLRSCFHHPLFACRMRLGLCLMFGGVAVNIRNLVSLALGLAITGSLPLIGCGGSTDDTSPTTSAAGTAGTGTAGTGTAGTGTAGTGTAGTGTAGTGTAGMSGGAGTAGAGGSATAGAGGGTSGMSGASGTGGSSSTLMCGTETCMSTTVQILTLDACCPDGTENRCGLDVTAAGQFIMGLKGCMELDQPGDLDASCPDFMAMGVTAAGCCRPEGMCGVVADFSGFGVPSFGCVDPAKIGQMIPPKACGGGMGGMGGAAGAGGSNMAGNPGMSGAGGGM
jgi:Mn2+/Fe2+ NRAMP family transporter